MAARFVLIHSPSVGPRTWQPVAHRLAELGWAAAVPSLLHVTDGGPPFWPRVVDAVRGGLGTAEQSQGVVLVAHSTARAAGPVAGQGIRWAAAALDRLVGRGGGGAAVPGPADPPGGDRGAAEAATVLLRGVGAGPRRLGCPAVRVPPLRAAL